MNRASVFRAYQRHAQQHPHDVAVFVEVALFHLVGFDLTTEHATHRFQIVGQIIGVCHILEAHRV